MDLYSIEFFIEKMDIPSQSVKHPDLLVQVTCADILDFRIKYFYKDFAYDVHNSDGCGKAVLFTTGINKLVTAFTTDFVVSIMEINALNIIAKAQIKWPPTFESTVRNFGKTSKFVQQNDKYKLYNDEGQQTGSIQVTMCLAYYGENIEVPITYLGSQLNIPLAFRKTAQKQVQLVNSEAWKPLFFSQKQQAKSVIDPGMEIYAQFAGVPVQPPMSTLLTSDYINEHLCGHKSCPGAKKFKQYGLGPLASAGSGLGTVSSLEKTKALGVYGMSQAYGTIDNYGAYGLFVKKPTRPKTCCGSPDCPYTIFYGKPEEVPEGEETDRPKMCQCKNCRKNNGSNSNSSKQSSKGSTCGSPKCPKNTPKNVVICPYLNPPPEQSCCSKSSKPKEIICPFMVKPPKQSNGGGSCCPKSPPKPKEVSCPFVNKQPRQSAGADNFYNADCPDNTCPYSTARQRRRQSANNTNGAGTCGGNVCPLETTTTNNKRASISEEPDYSSRQRRQSDNSNRRQSTNADTSAGTCGGNVCPFETGNANDTNEECLETCPYSTGRQRRQSDSSNRRPSLNSNGGNGKKNCKDKNCLIYQDDPADKDNEECPETCQYFTPRQRRQSTNSTAEKKNCNDKFCPYYKGDAEEETEEDVNGSCGGRVCPLDRKHTIIDPAEIFGEYSEKDLDTKAEIKQKRLSLLVNEDGRHLLISANGDNKSIDYKNLAGRSRDLLGSLSLADNSDVYLLISRLLTERQQSTSLNNYYAPDGLTSSQDIKGDYQSDRKDRKKRKGPCSKDSCRAEKYKTCSDCGGVSKSGATCDNTDVSFSTISYDSYATAVQTTPKTETENEDKSKAVSSVLKKKIGPTPTKLAVKIVQQRKIRTRFVYNEGESYPGIRIGHKKCSTATTKNVPAHMGWLWNIKGDWERKRRKKYKPGKVSKTVEERIIQNRRSKGIPDPPELSMLVKKKKFQYNATESESEDEEIVPIPTLIIEKKEGNYLITMNPLKDPKTLEDNENPYIRCKPLQFLILRPKKEIPPAPAITRYEEYDGEYGGEDDYTHFYDECCCDEKSVDSSSSSDSELNIEFTTPAGLITPERMKKHINVVNVENQFKEADFHCSDCPTIVPTIYKKERKKKKK